MRVLGLITEYNPFHNGHCYHIQKSKELTTADFVIVVMSGNYVQRGTPAVMNKYVRTEAALLNGADMVIELPVQYAVSGAGYFAGGAVALLDKLGIVNCICFGSECGDLNALRQIADILHDEPVEYRIALKNFLSSGNAYPTARNLAISAFLSDQVLDIPGLDVLPGSPNNQLAIEYLLALKKRNSVIKPYTITRTDKGYHDKKLDSPLVSATAIRALFAEDDAMERLKEYVPENTIHLLRENFQKTFPLHENDFSTLLGHSLLSKNLEDIFDVNNDLAGRIRSMASGFTNYRDFAQTVKRKNFNLTTINRAFLHTLLGIQSDDMEIHLQNDWLSYARILGFKKTSASLFFAELGAYSRLKLITKMANYQTLLADDTAALKMLEENIAADSIYRMVTMNKFGCNLTGEFDTSMIIQNQEDKP